RANAAIANPAFRPELFARAPAASATLLDLRAPPGDRLSLDGDHAGHYVIEDSRGVKLAEFHSARGQRVDLVHRRDVGKLFVRDLDDGTEIPLDPDAGPELAAQPRVAIATADRGPSDAVFGAVFSLPFDRRDVEDFRFPAPADVAEITDESTAHRWRRFFGWASLGTGAALAITAGGYAWSSHSIRDSIPAGSSEAVVTDYNPRIRSRSHLARALRTAAG